MSWEVIKTETDPCACGAGTVTFIVEMDDWNRFRNHRKIDCPACLEEARLRAAAAQAVSEKQEALYTAAKTLAQERYLERWLAKYSGLTKKAAWQLLTDGSRYPALGTFYKHVQEFGGVAEYMHWRFMSDFEAALQALSVADNEIEALLAERARLKGQG